MNYHITREVSGNLGEITKKLTESLKVRGFGVVTQIDMTKTLKDKLDADIRPYKILGVCNPPFAHQAIETEENIGLMLPCNVLIQEINDKIRISAINPAMTMKIVENSKLDSLAQEVAERLTKSIHEI